MVEFNDPNSPYKESIDNSIFIIPGIIVLSLVFFSVYKLVKALREKSRAKEEKKKLKQQRKDKENNKKRR